MKKFFATLVAFFVLFPAFLEGWNKRYIQPFEQEKRKVWGDIDLFSPFCPNDGVIIPIRVVIDKKGVVSEAKVAQHRSSFLSRKAVEIRSLLSQAIAIVLRYKYNPLLIGNKPVMVETFVPIRCRKQ